MIPGIRRKFNVITTNQSSFHQFQISVIVLGCISCITIILLNKLLIFFEIYEEPNSDQKLFLLIIYYILYATLILIKFIIL